MARKENMAGYDKWFHKIKAFNDLYVDMPDGAFFALAEEQGIDVEDWSWFADECKKRKTYK